MKITRKQLRQIIKEEASTLSEEKAAKVPETMEISKWVAKSPEGWRMAGSRDDNAFTPDFKGEAVSLKYTKSFEGRNYTVTIKVDVS